MRRGILGGTFDPPHLAHLVAAEAARTQLDLDVVSLLPAGAPWQKAGQGVTAARHRWEMTVLSVADVEYLEADDREVRRDGWTYTADTLATFPEVEQLTLILGADAALGLPTWHRPDDVVERAQIAVMPREGAAPDEVEAAVGAAVEWLDTPLLPISGTMLRARRRRGLSIRFLVRESVWSYLDEHELYDRA